MNTQYKQQPRVSAHFPTHAAILTLSSENWYRLFPQHIQMGSHMHCFVLVLFHSTVYL